MNLAIGPLPRQLAAFVLEHDIAEARRAHFAARPFVELVEEDARLAGGARRGDGAHRLVLERLERHVLAREHIASRRR